MRANMVVDEPEEFRTAEGVYYARELPSRHTNDLAFSPSSNLALDQYPSD